jgi:hypothetical protein
MNRFKTALLAGASLLAITVAACDRDEAADSNTVVVVDNNTVAANDAAKNDN